MKKVIFSVIAVFSVQAGFIALTSLDRQTEEDAKVAPVISAPLIDTSDVIAEIEPNAGESIYTEYTPIPARALNSPVSKDVINKGRRNPSPKQVPTQTTASLTNFEPVVIKIKAPQVRAQSERPQVAAAKLDQTEKRAFSAVSKPAKKRSFFSKSMSIIKTPFRWIRSLGSKIL